MSLLEEKQELIFPTRLVKSFGRVERAEKLLIEKSTALLSTCCEEEATCLKKTGEENPFVVLDFGKELQGGVRLIIPRARPIAMRLRLVFGESVSEALSSIGEKNATNHHSPRDTVVDVSNLSVLDFGRTGFRFVKVEVLTVGEISFKNIVAVSRTANIQRKGSFETSDPLFNQILETAIYTAYLCVQDGVIWDGIKRDRLVWSGDLNAEILTLAYAYGTLPQMKSCLRLLRAETPEGVWMNDIPSYSVWWILNLVDYCHLSGDTAFFEENIDYVNDLLRDLDVCIREDGVNFSITGKPTSRPYFLDWQSLGKPDAFAGTMMLVAYTMEKLRLFAELPYDKAAAERIAKRLEGYKTSTASMKETLALQAVCGGKKAKQSLERGGASGFSTFMSYFLMKGLSKSGSQKCVEIAKEYYGGMLSRGATTFWEDFNVEWLKGSGRIDEETPKGIKDLHADYGAFCYEGLRHSLCHGWSSGVVAYFVEEVLGLTVVERGFKKVRIRPNVAGLQWVRGSIPTPYGNIEIFASENGEMQVKLPDEIEKID